MHDQLLFAFTRTAAMRLPKSIKGPRICSRFLRVNSSLHSQPSSSSTWSSLSLSLSSPRPRSLSSVPRHLSLSLRQRLKLSRNATFPSMSVKERTYSKLFLGSPILTLCCWHSNWVAPCVNFKPTWNLCYPFSALGLTGYQSWGPGTGQSMSTYLFIWSS